MEDDISGKVLVVVSDPCVDDGSPVPTCLWSLARGATPG